jgi:hypothetical protein
VTTDDSGAENQRSFPPTSLVTGGAERPLTSFLVLPQYYGPVFIGYKWQDEPPQSILLRDGDGSTQPIEPGGRNYLVEPGATIEWTLSSPANHIRIEWRCHDDIRGTRGALATCPADEPLTGFIDLPEGGDATIYYEWQDAPAQSVWLRDSDGARRPIEPGLNRFAISPGSRIEWTLASPVNAIKVQWRYERPGD